MQHYRCHPLLRLILHTCHFSSFQFSIHLLVTCHIHLNRASLLLFLPLPPHHIFLLQHSQLSRRIQIGFNILRHPRPRTINRYTTTPRTLHSLVFFKTPRDQQNRNEFIFSLLILLKLFMLPLSLSLSCFIIKLCSFQNKCDEVMANNMHKMIMMRGYMYSLA